MTKSEWKKLYSNYRRTIHSFNADMTNSNYPCGYDDMLAENFQRATERHLKANPVLRSVLEQIDSYDYQFDYCAITDEFRNYRYQNAWNKDGKIVWINKQ